MATKTMNFDERLRAISKRRNKMSDGVRYQIGKDGLIVALPRRRAPRFPLRGIMLMFAAGMLFKVFLYVSLGAITYETRVNALASGSVFEQVGAWVMRADPATIWLAQQAGGLVR